MSETIRGLNLMRKIFKKKSLKILQIKKFFLSLQYRNKFYDIVKQWDYNFQTFQLF